MSKYEDIVDEFRYVFSPRSIAVIGATSNTASKVSLANHFISTLIDYGYSGKLYAVGNSGGELLGLPVYSSIKDIPGEVDYVITAIPNILVPQLMGDCGQKGVKVVHLFVSGFGEIEDRIGAELQDSILKQAKRYRIRLIGPNCMGVYCPATRITYDVSFSKVVGKVGYLVQSGGQSIMGVKEANRRNIYFSKVVSYGNAADTNECDLIEYFTEDTDTEIITAYIEGTNEGQRLLQAIKTAASKKPVVVFKGADTPGGSQAATSHTSAIAGSSLTWEALFRQTGVIRVYNVQEMFDVVTVLQNCAVPQGLRAALVGHGGGSCVQASDECYRAGLQLPVLSLKYRQALKDIYLSEAGNIFKNPVDINPYWGIEQAKEAFRIVDKWTGADINILFSTPEQTPFKSSEWEYEVTTDTLLEWASLSTKPTIIAMNVNTIVGDDSLPGKHLRKVIGAGYAVFPSVSRAANALARVYRYYQWRKKHSAFSHSQ